MRNSVIWDKVKGNPCNAKDKLRNIHEYVFHFTLQNQYFYDVASIRSAPKRPYYRNGKLVTPTGVSGAKYEKQINQSNELSEEEKSAALQSLRHTLSRVENGEIQDFRMIIRGTQRSTHSNSPEFSGRANELKTKGFCILPYHKDGPKPADVWHIIPEDQWRKGNHYAVFPTELCDTPIKATSSMQGIVLDPFVGTGTSIISAIELGRRAIGIDTSTDYLEEAASRIDSKLLTNSKLHSQQQLFYS